MRTARSTRLPICQWPRRPMLTPTSMRRSMGRAVLREPERNRSMSQRGSARTYNHLHTQRSYTRGKRRFSIYWTWSYPWEANRDTTELDNRFSTMTEVRRVGWPAYETEQYPEKMFLQGIAGTLELFHLSIVRFQEVVGAVTGSPAVDVQRIDQ